ncbi:MAG: hypothetical protein U1F76_14345 [Candidatus Competibacteraceae bacterium]
MPQINVLFWNLQNLGDLSPYRHIRRFRAQFVASVAHLAQADVICIQELKQSGANHDLPQLQSALNQLPAPFNNWYYDWIKGAINNTPHPGAQPPYNTAAHLMWSLNHFEGYAVFWNQNIAKFKVTQAPPIVPPGGVPALNTQSETVRMMGLAGGGAAGMLPVPGLPVPAGGITVPGGGAGYTLPIGTTAPAGAVIAGVPPGGVVAAMAVAAGLVLPAGTQIGPAGVTTNVAVNGVNPVVVPGGYTLTEPLTLPAAGTVLVPEHAASLVLLGRNIAAGPPGRNPRAFNGDVSAATPYFVPGALYNWDWLWFTRGRNHPAAMLGTRRPCYITLDVNRNPPVVPANRLVPVIVYHAPSAAPASCSGMQRAAYSQPMYQAYDPAGAWIDCTFSVLGGDFNVETDAVPYAYNAFRDNFGPGGGNPGGGANATAGIYNAAPPGLTRAANVLNKSTVQINGGNGFGAPIFSPNTDNYRWMAIDNVFYRGFAAPAAGAALGAGMAVAQIFDQLPAVTIAGGAPPIPAIQNFTLEPTFRNNMDVIAGIIPGPAMPAPDINDMTSTLTDIASGRFGSGVPLPVPLPAPPQATTPRRGALLNSFTCASATTSRSCSPCNSDRVRHHE